MNLNKLRQIAERATVIEFVMQPDISASGHRDHVFKRQLDPQTVLLMLDVLSVVDNLTAQWMFPEGEKIERSSVTDLHEAYQKLTENLEAR